MLSVENLTKKQIDSFSKYHSCIMSGMPFSYRNLIERLSDDVEVWMPSINVLAKTGRFLKTVKRKRKAIFLDYGFVFYKTIEDKIRFFMLLKQFLYCKILFSSSLTLENLININVTIKKLEDLPITDLQIGDVVEVIKGAFSNMKGKVVYIDSKKVLVEIVVFNRVIPTEFDCEILEKI